MHGLEYIWFIVAVIGLTQALGQGQYYSGQGYFNNSCPITQCATDCGVGMYRSGCANASAGVCVTCTGLVPGNSWTTQGYLNNSCQQVGTTTVTTPVATTTYIQYIPVTSTVSTVSTQALELSTTSQMPMSTTTQMPMPTTAQKSLSTTTPMPLSTTAQPTTPKLLTSQPTPKLSTTQPTPKLSTTQPATQKSSTVRLSNQLSQVSTTLATEPQTITLDTPTTTSPPENSTRYAVQFTMSVPVEGTLNSSQYMQTISTISVSSCGVCAPVDPVTLICPYCQIHIDIAYSNARRLLTSTAIITTTIHVNNPVAASDLVKVLNNTSSKQAISLSLGSHVIFIQLPFMTILESIISETSSPNIGLIVGCAVGGIVLIAASAAIFVLLHKPGIKTSSKFNSNFISNFNWNFGGTSNSTLSGDARLMGKKSVQISPGERRHGLNEPVRRLELIYMM